jgi:hypothetical protein
VLERIVHRVDTVQAPLCALEVAECALGLVLLCELCLETFFVVEKPIRSKQVGSKRGFGRSTGSAVLLVLSSRDRQCETRVVRARGRVEQLVDFCFERVIIFDFLLQGVLESSQVVRSLRVQGSCGVSQLCYLPQVLWYDMVLEF